jgi:hypothetical protein
MESGAADVPAAGGPQRGVNNHPPANESPVTWQKYDKNPDFRMFILK